MASIKFAKSVALEAAEIFNRSKPRVVKEKGGAGNWVTEADLAVERFIVDRIRSQYSNHRIISEENDTEESPEAEDIWIIDPLDGTTNAVFGFPHYAISIAYMKERKVLLSVVLEIPSKKLYWAQKDEGAFMNDGKLEIADKPLKQALVASDSPYSREDFIHNHQIADKVHQAGNRIVITGSAVVSAVYVAEGLLSLYFGIGLKTWDVSATKLIIEEAGGVAESFEGSLDIFNFKTFVCGGRQAVEEFRKLLL